MSHTCHNLVLTCMDFRFRNIHDDFIKSLGDSDRVSLAGASKAIVDKDTQAAILKQLVLSNQLHGATNIYIVDHEDCGAYGGKKAFQSDQEELNVHQDNLTKAKELILKELPQVKVIGKFAQLSGEVNDLR